MRPLRRALLATLAACLAVAVTLAPGASADTLVTAILGPGTPQNLASYGATSAWVVETAPGKLVLVTYEQGGAIVAAPVKPFTRAPLLSVGPQKSGARLVVYSRCSAAGARCDVYGYDPVTKREQRISAVSRSGASSESAPSYYKGAFTFARTGSGKSGTFLYEPGRASRRIDAKVPYATTLGEQRIGTLVWPKAPSGGQTFIRLITYRGQARTVESATVTDAGGSRLGAPVMTRYFLYWRSSDPISETSAAHRAQFGGSRRTVVEVGSRALPGSSLAVAQRPAGLLSYIAQSGSAAGLFVTDPPMTFTPLAP